MTVVQVPSGRTARAAIQPPAPGRHALIVDGHRIPGALRVVG